MLKELIKLADLLDKRNYKIAANRIDKIITAQKAPQITLAFTTAILPAGLQNKWFSLMTDDKMEVSQGTNNTKDAISLTAKPNDPQWHNKITYSLSAATETEGGTSGSLGALAITQLSPEQIDYIKTYLKKQAQELNVITGQLLSQLG